MNRLLSFLFSLLFLLVFGQSTFAQKPAIPKLTWKVNRIDLGTILEEQGLQRAEFEFTNAQDSSIVLEEVLAECGCTSVEFSQDTVKKGASGKVVLSFDPTSAAGFFSKLVVVKGNAGAIQDSLFLEGTAIPYPSNLKLAYPVKLGSLGFRLKKVNMGDVFDNEPKVKYVEFFNFGEELLEQGKFLFKAPEYIKMEQVQPFVRGQERGLIKIIYDSKLKNDLGFFEDEVSLSWKSDTPNQLTLLIIADLFEYFPPISKEQLNEIPQLLIAQKVIDLKEISSNSIVRRQVTISNAGKKPLEIRKIQGNCECLTIESPKSILEPGESIALNLVFNPMGRKGIDQRNIYLFTNDPVNPVQLILLKSRIE
ncbi:MAG: DUF1573 domain-containing protein [Algoriphagus sp.]|nr:DUF1573 domain-containing protein [Algoriphagus sp.]